jgi:hypothetical protein
MSLNEYCMWVSVAAVVAGYFLVLVLLGACSPRRGGGWVAAAGLACRDDPRYYASAVDCVTDYWKDDCATNGCDFAAYQQCCFDKYDMVDPSDEAPGGVFMDACDSHASAVKAACILKDTNGGRQ